MQDDAEETSNCRNVITWMFVLLNAMIPDLGGEFVRQQLY